MTSDFESFALLSTYVYEESLGLGGSTNEESINSERVLEKLKVKYGGVQGISITNFGKNVISMSLENCIDTDFNFSERYSKFCNELCGVNEEIFSKSYSPRLFRIVLPPGRVLFQNFGGGSVKYFAYPFFELILSPDGCSFRRNVTYECMLLLSSLSISPDQESDPGEVVLTQPYSAESLYVEESPLLHFLKAVDSRFRLKVLDKGGRISLQRLLDVSKYVAEEILETGKKPGLGGDIFRFIKLNTSYDETSWLEFRKKFNDRREPPWAGQSNGDKRLMDHVLKVTRASEYRNEGASEAEILFQYVVSSEKFYLNRSIYIYVNQSKTLLELGPRLPGNYTAITSGPFTLDSYGSYTRNFFYTLGIMTNISILSSILLYYYGKVSPSKSAVLQDIGRLEDELVLDYDEYYDFVLKNSGYRNVISRIREMSFLNSDFVKLRDRIKTLKENENRRHDTAVSKSLSILTIAVVLVSFLDTIVALVRGVERMMSLSILVIFIAFVSYYVLHKNRP